ncbi:MAG: TetR/AcrR family transcriptional regulator [Microbacterium sp.]
MAVPRGRPRSEESRRRILEATCDLLREGGLSGVSMDAISARARVSKQTLYRWWPSKSMIVLEAVLEGYEPPVPSTVVVSSDREADMDAWIQRSIDSLSDPATAAAVRALLGALATDTEAGRRYQSRTLATARTAVADMLSRRTDPDGAHRQDALRTADVAISALMFWVLVGERLGDHHREALRLLLRAAPTAPRPAENV